MEGDAAFAGKMLYLDGAKGGFFSPRLEKSCMGLSSKEAARHREQSLAGGSNTPNVEGSSPVQTH